jgi:hypothetical protein
LKQSSIPPRLSIHMRMILPVRRFARLRLIEAGMTCGSTEIITPALEGTLGILRSVLKHGYGSTFIAKIRGLFH